MGLQFCLILLFFYAMFSPLWAQSPSSYQLDFRKNNTSWVWLANLNASVKTGAASHLQLSNQFTTNLYRQSFQTDKWRDENTLGVSWNRAISPRLSARTLLESRVFSDENTSVRFSKHLIAQEVSLEPLPRLKVIPALGWTVEDAFDRQDQGWYGRLGLSLSKFDMSGYLNNTELNSVIRSFPGRKNQEFSFFTGWTRQFSEFAVDSIRVGYQFSENRFYISPLQITSAVSNPQEQVLINARFLFNQLNYKTSENTALAILTNFKNRDIDQSNPSLKNRREELSLENQINFQVQWSSLLWESAVLFSQVRNDNPGVRTDVNTLQSAFSQRLQYRPGQSDRLWGRFSFTKFEYNTPSVFTDQSDRDTRDDRDELRFIIDTGYQHRFSPHYQVTLRSNVYLYHQIYLRSGRSNRNNWNRIFQLAGAFDHRVGRWLVHQHQLKILSNFTVFDFDEILPQVNSFVFRKLIYSDSLTIRLSDNLSISNIYQLEKEDNGSFFKKEFSQQVTKELTANYFNINLQHRNILGLRVTGGVALFVRDEWSNIPDRRKVRQFRSVTPRFTVVYPAGSKLLLYLTYGFTRSTDFGEEIQRFASGNVNLQYAF